MNDSEFDDAYEDKDLIRGAILDTPISDLVLREPIVVDPSTTVFDAVQAMRKHHIGCVLVLSQGKLVGIFTERDVLKRVVFHDEDQSMLVASVMTKNPETLEANQSMAFALNKMCVGGYRHIPIVEPKGKVIGVLSVQDIVAFLVDLFPTGILNLPTSPSMGIAKGTDGG